MNLQELRDQRGRLLNEHQQILDATATRAWTPEETTKFDKIDADYTAIDAQIKRLETFEGRRAMLDGSTRQTDHNDDQTRAQHQQGAGGGQLNDYQRGEGLRGWMCAGSPVAAVTQQQRDLARRCGFDVNHKQIVIPLGPSMKANRPTVAGMAAGAEDIRTWNTKIAEERAALTGAQGTTTTGGYTVADELMRALEVALLAFGGMRSTSTILRTATGGPLPIPTVNDTAAKGELIAENTTATELEMVFGQLILDAYRYTSKYIVASIEFLQDTSINVNEFLGTALGNRIARITNDHFTTGTGVGQPKGIVVAATASGVTTSANGVVSYDNLVDLEHSIDPAYRVNSRFMFHDTALKLLKKIKVIQYSGDPTGTPLWVPGLASGAPDTIMGYPYTINQSMAPIGAGSKSILFGQLDKYLIRDVRDVSLMRLEELYALLGSVAFLAISRHDGDLVDAGTNPVKYLTQGA